MVIPTASLREALLHFIMFINGVCTGALVGVVVYRNVTLKWSTKRRLW